MGIIAYNELKYAHEIKGLDKFVSAYLERQKNRIGIVWDYEKEDRREINKKFSNICNTLSVKEIQKKGVLQDKVGRWLYSKGNEWMSQPLMIYNEIVFVEVKVSE